jgi:uncharacterized protein
MSIVGDFSAGLTAMEAPLDARLAFLRRTYLTLAGAIGAFAVLCYAFVVAGIGEQLMAAMGGRWLFVIGGLMLVAWISNSMAAPNKSKGSQFAGLALYTAAEALFFSPLIWLATTHYPGVLGPAAATTAIVFGGLTFYVVTTRKDFSFLGGALRVAGFGALGLIVASVFFPITLGTWFSAAMVLFAAGAILYDTSNILHHYRTDQSTGAALSLFASVMLLFWYVLRIFMASRD